MKVYIVTKGCYSDYTISKVFLDKTKAERYVKYFNASIDDGLQIEEYDTDDEMIITPMYYADIRYNILTDDFSMNIVPSHSDDERHIYNTNLSFTPNYARVPIIRLYREVKSPENGFDYYDKYLKVCRDMGAQVKHMITEGINEYEIIRAIEGKDWNE